jgi:hypothetical protein
MLNVRSWDHVDAVKPTNARDTTVGDGFAEHVDGWCQNREGIERRGKEAARKWIGAGRGRDESTGERAGAPTGAGGNRRVGRGIDGLGGSRSAWGEKRDNIYIYIYRVSKGIKDASVRRSTEALFDF